MATTRAQLTFSLLCCAVMPTVVQAQDKPADPPPIAQNTTANPDEIVVTARKRSESVQNVPISVDVTSGETLQRTGIVDLDGIKTLTTGLTMRRSANQVTVPTLRGLGTGTSSETFEQSIAEFIDGTYVGRSPEMEGGVFDLERVEIIKGTQAALLAKNTSLGAISMITRKPGDRFEYNVSAGYDVALGSPQVEGGVSIPITDDFAVRLSGLARRQNGWVHNDITGANDPRSTSWAGRVVAQWRPGKVDATVLYQHFDTDVLGNGVEFVADVLGTARRLALLAGNPNFETRLDYHNSPTNSGFRERGHTNGDRLIGTINYELGEYTLTSVTSYSRFDQHVDGDKDFNTGTYVTQITGLGNDQVSQELRITSPANRPFNFVAGGYYQNEVFNYSRSSFLSAVLPINGAFSDGVKISTDTFSAFGQANYEFVPGLTANVGARVTNEARTGAYGDRVYSIPGTVRALYPPFSAASRHINDTNLDGSVGLQYKTGDALFYASASRGTKGGTFLSAPTTPANSIIDAEEATTFELGSKLSFSRGVFNVALFTTKINNLQQASFNGQVFITDPRDVRSYGFEAETGYRLTPNLRVNASVTYAHARQIADAAHPGDNSRVVNAPLWSGLAGIDYEHDVGSSFRFTANANVNYRSEVIFVPENQTAGYGTNPTTAVVPPGRSNARMNGRLGFGPRDASWEVALVGRNLTDARTLIYANPGAFQTGSAIGTLDLPRTVMIQLNLKY